MEVASHLHLPLGWTRAQKLHPSLFVQEWSREDPQGASSRSSFIPRAASRLMRFMRTQRKMRHELYLPVKGHWLEADIYSQSQGTGKDAGLTWPLWVGTLCVQMTEELSEKRDVLNL